MLDFSKEKKFQLYFAGIGSNVALQHLRDTNSNQLLSQLNERTTIKKWCQYLEEHPECTSKLFIDSGAFSAHTKGKDVDVDDYINFINGIDKHVYIFAQVDKIPGVFGKPKTDEQLASAPKESWDNYLYMRERVISRDKLLPVFHQGEDFTWLVNMLEFRHPEDGKPIDYIGISPANDVSVKAKMGWLVEVFKIIKASSNPNVKTHAFGMTSLYLLEQFPITSADSTTWVILAANGGIMTKYGVVKVSDRTETSEDNIFYHEQVVIDSLQSYLDNYGYAVNDIKTNTDARKLYHIDYLTEWQQNYKFRGQPLQTVSLLDYDGAEG